jgi:hypothetical protein
MAFTASTWCGAACITLADIKDMLKLPTTGEEHIMSPGRGCHCHGRLSVGISWLWGCRAFPKATCLKGGAVSPAEGSR